MFQVPQPTLAAALNIVKDGAKGKSTLPILSTVRLKATQAGELTLATTNLTTAYTLTIPARVDVPGSICLPFATLESMVRAAYRDRPLIVTVGEGFRATITSGAREHTLAGLDPDDYPVLPEADGAVLTLQPGVLRNLESVIHAAATDDTRPVLASVNLRATGGELCAEAADGFRMVRRFIPGVEASMQVNPPASALATMLAKIDPDGESVDLITTTSGNQWALRQTQGDGSRLVMITRLIDGKFPDVDRVIPASHAVRIIIAKIPLRGTLKAAEVIARDSNNIVRLIIAGETLTIAASATEVGSTSEVLHPKSIAWVDGAPQSLTIAVNLAFFAEALDETDAEEVAIAVTTPQLPLIVTPVGWAPERGSQLALLMPMTVSSARS